MARILLLLVGFVLLSIMGAKASADDAFDSPAFYTEHVVRCTYRIQGFDGHYGTGLFIGCPVDSLRRIPAIVTARHVFDSIRSDSVQIFLRRYTGTGLVEVHPWTIQIRKDSIPLYHVHPDSNIDLAGMRFPLPKDPRLDPKIMSKSMFVSDSALADAELHTGDEVYFIGYPWGFASTQGDFPLVRSGIIASYPILPFRSNPVYYIDGPVKKGNSGGPVLLAQRSEGKTLPGFIVGIVSNSQGQKEIVQSRDEVVIKTHDLGIAGVVNSGYILDFFDILDCTYYSDQDTTKSVD
ncbi:MAG: serine protease [candidate division Zixibacteria bacterium]|nr:serine protease [candidate division Zixibacteria bacterium]